MAAATMAAGAAEKGEVLTAAVLTAESSLLRIQMIHIPARDQIRPDRRRIRVPIHCLTLPLWPRQFRHYRQPGSIAATPMVFSPI